MRLRQISPVSTPNQQEASYGDLSEVNETTLGLSMCILVGCPDILTLRPTCRTGQPDVTATGPSHADSEDHQAYIEGPAMLTYI